MSRNRELVYSHGEPCIVGPYRYCIQFPTNASKIKSQAYAALLEMWLKQYCRNKWRLLAYHSTTSPWGDIFELDLYFSNRNDFIFFKLKHNQDELDYLV